MPKKKAAPVAIPPELIKEKVEGTALIKPLKAAALTLTVSTQDDYLKADTLLGRIFTARATWAAKMAPVRRPLQKAIDAAKATLVHAKEAMLGADTLFSEIDGPLLDLDADIRGQMGAFKLKEARELREAETAREVERARLAEEIRKTSELELNAKTKAIAQRLEVRRQGLVQQAVAVEVVEEQAPAPVKGTSSQSRNVRDWRVLNMDTFIKGCADGSIPADVLTLDLGKMQEYFREPITRAQMDKGEWPGLEVFDDVIIARQGQRGTR